MKHNKREENGEWSAERDGRGGLSEDAEQKEKRKVVRDGRSEREGRKISSPGGIISRLSH